MYSFIDIISLGYPNCDAIYPSIHHPNIIRIVIVCNTFELVSLILCVSKLVVRKRTNVWVTHPDHEFTTYVFYVISRNYDVLNQRWKLMNMNWWLVNVMLIQFDFDRIRQERIRLLSFRLPHFIHFAYLGKWVYINSTLLIHYYACMMMYHLKAIQGFFQIKM